MKKKNFKYPKVYLYAAALGLLVIIGLVGYHLFCSMSTSDEAQYV